MGTNYYWVAPPCEHCGRSDDRLHICKTYTMFHGTFDEDAAGEPIPKPVSWQQWKEHLRTAEGRIVDEYGREHDVEDFIAEVEATSPEARRWQYDWVASHPRHGHVIGNIEPGADWLDEDGFSFYGASFQ